MNRAVPELRSRAIVSFSDAHSPQRLGRELTAFPGPLSWAGLSAALRCRKVAYTIEFYPEEGKYHYSGHRKCGVSLDTAGLDANGPDCPVCHRPLTLGVLHRVSSLADRPIRNALTPAADGFIYSDTDTDASAGASANANAAVNANTDSPPFARLVPLPEIISAVRKVGVNSRTVQREYAALADALDNELNALLHASPGDLTAAAGPELADAILRARAGHIDITPGYDGQYGAVRIPAAAASG